MSAPGMYSKLVGRRDFIGPPILPKELPSKCEYWYVTYTFEDGSKPVLPYFQGLASNIHLNLPVILL